MESFWDAEILSQQRSPYLPFLSGKYEVTPGLKPLPAVQGLSVDDEACIFQFDDFFEIYARNKQLCRRENLQKYILTHQLPVETEQEVVAFCVHRLLQEHPHLFELKPHPAGFLLVCRHTQQKFILSPQYKLISHLSFYSNLWDALADQIQEDVAIWQLAEHTDYLAAIHLCAPNYWSPAEKIGRPFSEVHLPVAGMENLRKQYRPMLEAIVRKGSFVRFAWGLTTDCRLNHHPEPPPSFDVNEWAGRQFDPQNPTLFVRVERQTLTGFPAVNALMFTIRTYFQPVGQLDSEARLALRTAIATMSEESLVYKGLRDSKDAILAWMEGA
jgi:hypothetical protein